MSLCVCSIDQVGSCRVIHTRQSLYSIAGAWFALTVYGFPSQEFPITLDHYIMGQSALVSQNRFLFLCFISINKQLTNDIGSPI